MSLDGPLTFIDKSPMQGILGFYGMLRQTHLHLKACKKSEGDVDTIKVQWALKLLEDLKLQVEIKGTPCKDESLLLLGNHISYVDIPLLLGHIGRLSFVAKKEVRSWPFIGPGAEHIGCVFVNRNSSSSRNEAKRTIQQAIVDGRRVVIFPSGTTSIPGQKPWKKGAFEIAHETGCLVQPFRINYTPLRKIAYIDDDFFPTHAMRLYKEKEKKPLVGQLELHDPVRITDPLKDCEYWSQWSNFEI
jgi:1-acyl-sn-glycerol-3-phosphate acyltransferase